MKKLVAIAMALFVCAAGLVLAVLGGGVAHLPPEALHSAYPSHEEVSSWNFMAGEYDALREAGRSPQLVLGSSELKSKPAGPAHPGRLFADGRYGASSVIVGRAGVNDLWQAIEVGAFSPRMTGERKRVAIFVSMQWFMCYRDPRSSFPGVFSQGAYDAFMDNPSISADVKRRVADRVRAYGVDDAEPPQGGPLENAVALIDRSASAVSSDMRLAAALRARAERVRGDRDASTPRGDGAAASGDGASSRDGGAVRTQEGAPDWEALIAEGRDEAERLSSGNDLGYYDAWYRSSFDDWLTGARGTWSVDDGNYWSGQELEDLKLMLEVCRQVGVEPLVVIQPVKGAAYDQTIYTREVRGEYYDMVRAACADAGVQVADFSDREYDRLFLRDYSHPSAYGSAWYSRAIYDFWTE